MQACIPAQPDPPPLATFRGQPLTHETAEALFIGCARRAGVSAFKFDTVPVIDGVHVHCLSILHPVW